MFKLFEKQIVHKVCSFSKKSYFLVLLRNILFEVTVTVVNIFVPACLPAFLPAFLPSLLPAFLPISSFLVWALHRLQFLQEFLSPLVWVLRWLQRISAPSGTTFSSNICVPSVVYQYFFFLMTSSYLCGVFCPFLNIFSQKDKLPSLIQL